MNKLFRPVIGTCVALIALWLSLRLNRSSEDLAMNAMECYLNEACFMENHHGNSAGLAAVLSEEISCASRADSFWAKRFPCHDETCLPQTLSSILAMTRPLKMRSRIMLSEIDGEANMDVMLSEHLSNGNEATLSFHFSERKDRYELHSIKGLCALLSKLSLARKQQLSAEDPETRL